MCRWLFKQLRKHSLFPSSYHPIKETCCMSEEFFISKPKTYPSQKTRVVRFEFVKTFDASIRNYLYAFVQWCASLSNFFSIGFICLTLLANFHFSPTALQYLTFLYDRGDERAARKIISCGPRSIQARPAFWTFAFRRTSSIELTGFIVWLNSWTARLLNGNWQSGPR